MPDLRFLSEASFFIGCGVGGIPLAVVGYLLGMQHPRFPIVAYGRSWYKEVGSWKSGSALSAERKVIAPKPGAARISAPQVTSSNAPKKYRPNPRTLLRLEAMIRNEYGSDGQRIPAEGVQLSHPFLKRAKITAADELRAYILERGHGYTAPSGGGETVYLRRENALMFLRRQDENRRKK